jgi:predicted nucleotidyltransferase
MVPKRHFVQVYSVRLGLILSVVGSYARGAPTYSDLDLLLDLDIIEGSMPSIQTLLRQVFAVFLDLLYYHGKREQISSRIARRRSAIQRRHARGVLVALVVSDWGIVGEVGT